MILESSVVSSFARPSRRLSEIYLWIIFALIISGRMILTISKNWKGQLYFEDLTFFYYDMLGAIFVLLFPILFSQIFSRLPFEHFRYKNAMNTINYESIKTVNNDSITMEEKEVFEKQVLGTDSSTVQMQKLAKSSKEISEGLYTRSGVYLFIGVIIAFSGLAFFYIETAKSSVLTNITQSKTAIEKPVQPVTPDSEVVTTQSSLLQMAPKFGMLFFIEMVAFFFLRQYKEAMDEYRYYESIKRKREENLVIIMLNQETENKMELSELLSSISLYSDKKNLASGETTEILESKKLDSKEIALLEKVISAVITKK